MDRVFGCILELKCLLKMFSAAVSWQHVLRTLQVHSLCVHLKQFGKSAFWNLETAEGQVVYEVVYLFIASCLPKDNELVASKILFS